jgi:hypothetical protein
MSTTRQITQAEALAYKARAEIAERKLAEERAKRRTAEGRTSAVTGALVAVVDEKRKKELDDLDKAFQLGAYAPDAPTGASYDPRSATLTLGGRQVK